MLVMSHTKMEMQKVHRERGAESGEPCMPKYGMGCGNQLARGLVSLSLGPGLPYLNILPVAGTSGNESTCPNMGLNVFAAMITVQVTSPSVRSLVPQAKENYDREETAKQKAYLGTGRL